METKARTLVKSTVWVALGWFVMVIVGLIFTGSLAVGGAMAAVNSAIGFITYIFYERVWSGISWGRRNA